MSKVIGITPGPVEFTNLDSEDLAEINQFEPASTGSTGQVLTKTESGYDWATASGMIDNALVRFQSSFDCETNDFYQGNIPIDPEQTQAGSICVSIYYFLTRYNSGRATAMGTNSFLVSLANDGNGAFEGSVTINNGYDDIITFYVTLTPENQQGTIIYNTHVEAFILCRYSSTNNGQYSFGVSALSGGGEAIPQIVSGCANAEY